MPCCTLTAFLLSQLALAAGAVKARFFGGMNPIVVPGLARTFLLRSRWAAMAAVVGFEALLAGAAAPYAVTPWGRAAVAKSFASAWHICSLGAVLSAEAVYPVTK